MLNMKRLLKPANALWLLVLVIGIIAVRILPWSEIIQALKALTFAELGILLIINGVIVLLFCARWWIILHAFGYTLPYFKLSGYRIAGYAISYFTPGTQFGGEPLQVYLVQSRHAVPTGISLAAVTLDKLFELLANFSFLALGILLITSLELIPGLANPNLAAWIGGLMVFPVAYFFVLASGRFPLSAIFQWLSERFWIHPRLKKLPPLVTATERQMSTLFRRHPWLVLGALLLSVLVWVMMVFEYWLMSTFLGAHLSPLQAVAGYTAMRAAFLSPLPGGVGLLEASQVLTMQAFGYSSALGISLSLLIRARDLVVGIFGLWVGGVIGARQAPAMEKIATLAPAIKLNEVEVVQPVD